MGQVGCQPQYNPEGKHIKRCQPRYNPKGKLICVPLAGRKESYLPGLPKALLLLPIMPFSFSLCSLFGPLDNPLVLVLGC